MTSRIALLLLAASLGSVAGAETGQQFTSGADRVALLELYTSEGCSSCPPADRWLSGLKSSPGLWSDFVPVAYHVDYWDYIGWSDRYANPEYSERQRQHVQEGAADVVYTPGVFLAGREWLDWRRRSEPAIDAATAGELKVDVDTGTIAVRYLPAPAVAEPFDVHIAVLGMGLESAVRRGENRGRKLRHDFVVLAHESMSMTAAGPVFTASTDLADTRAETTQLALAVWVSPADSVLPLQAAGGLLN